MPEVSATTIKFHGAPMKLSEPQGPWKERRWTGAQAGKPNVEVEVWVLRTAAAREIRMQRKLTATIGGELKTTENVILDFDHEGKLLGTKSGEISPGLAAPYISVKFEERTMERFLNEPSVREWLEKELAPPPRA